MSNLSYVYLDEPHLMSETLFLNAQARAREAGSQLRIGLASLPKIGWLSREFQGRNGEHRRVIHASTEQNKFNHPDYIANMKRACPARMQACYLQGQFIPDGDAVYPEFNRDIHVIPWKYTPEIRNAKDQWTSTEIGYVFDWSPRRPHVLWCQHVPPPVKMPGGWITNKEITVVVDEIYPDGKYTGGVPTVKLCHMAKSRKPRSSSRNYPCMWAVCDPAGKAVQSTSGESDIIQAERILGVNMLYLFGQRIRIGIQHVKLALEPLEGHPTLFFSDDLIKYAVEPKERSVIRSMEGYSYAAQKGSILDDDPDHDDIFSHACDDIRYHQTYFFAEDRLNSEIWSAQ